MEKFEYRTPRFAVNIPVQMTLARSSLRGQCVDINEEGMRVECPQLDFANARGTVTVVHPQWTSEVEVQVAYTTSTHFGLRFLYRAERERRMVARFVESLGYIVSSMPSSSSMTRPRHR